jgi:single-strand DNA-binding protein
MSYSNINRVVLVGRLTQDPELRELPSGRSVCNLRLACNGSRRDLDGTYHERPQFFDVATFGAQAVNVSRYQRKGSRVAIDGRLEWREWETADQQRRQAVSVVAESIEFLDRPTGEHGSAEGDELGGEGHESLLSGVGAGEREAELVF